MNYIQEILENIPKNARVNYDEVMREVMYKWSSLGKRPKILIHSCCAPCSTYVLDLLNKYADITIFYSNSNIHPRNEYIRRSLIQKDFIRQFNTRYQAHIQYIEDEYKPQEYHQIVHQKKLEQEREGGKRCEVCFNLRLDRVAIKAVEGKYDYFASAMSVSPYKNANLINNVGMELQVLYNTSYLPTDFKKQGGYQKSIKMSEEFNLYRQCYCGCIFSAKQHEIDLIQVNKEAQNWIEEYYSKYPNKKE